MDSIIKFKEAAQALQQDERYESLVKAREAKEQDEQLQGMIGEFNLARLELNNEMGKDPQDTDKIAALNEKVNSLYTQVMQNPNMEAYNQAKHGIESFMEYVNAILNTAIEGGDPMQVDEPTASACSSGGCSSCSGCH